MWHVRDGRVADAAALAAVHVAAWQVAYRGLVPDAVLDGLDVVAGAARWRDLIAATDPARAVLVLVADADADAVGDGGPVLAGMASVVARTPDLGELEEIVVDPARWGGGGGRVLLRAATDALRAAGSTEAVLRVLPANGRAVSLYESEGWVEDGSGTDADGRRTYRRSLTA